MQRFEYRARPAAAIGGRVLGLAFVAGCGVAFASEWGIRLYGAGVEPAIARWFDVGGVLLGVLLLVMSVLALSNGRREIVVSLDRIELPRGELARGSIVIAPHEVRRLSFRHGQGIVTLLVHHARGTVKLPSPHFASRDAFVACIDAIESVLPQPR